MLQSFLSLTGYQSHWVFGKSRLLVMMGSSGAAFLELPLLHFLPKIERRFPFALKIPLCSTHHDVTRHHVWYAFSLVVVTYAALLKISARQKSAVLATRNSALAPIEP